MRTTKSKLKALILEELLAIDLIEELPEVREKTIREEIKNIVLEFLEEGHGLAPLPPTPTLEPWRDSPHFSGAVDKAVEQLWTSLHGDQHPEQPVAVAEGRLQMWKRDAARASERVEQWEEIVKELKKKAGQHHGV